MDHSTFLLEGLPASPSPLPVSALVCQTPEETLPWSSSRSLTVAIHSGYSGKMCPAFLAAPEELTFETSYVSSPEWRYLSRAKGGKTPEWFADRTATTLSPGACWTLNTSEFRNAAAVSFLSDILETGVVPPQYFLSRKACLGILRRAANRGKELPPVLMHALKAVAQTGEATSWLEAA